MKKSKVATSATIAALAAALAVTNLPRPTLVQVEQFVRIYQSPAATLEQTSSWDWKMTAPIPGTDSTAILRMYICETNVAAPASE